VPELALVRAALLADGVGLLEVGRAEHLDLHPRQNLFQPRLHAVVNVLVRAHRHQVLYRREVGEVILAEERQLAVERLAEDGLPPLGLDEHGPRDGVHVA
jgi:hypothetical protein